MTMLAGGAEWTGEVFDPATGEVRAHWDFAGGGRGR
jgi:malonate-semialdehyde dehydrogenase (acetylating)/methylmalonate-semialdehyde dehydrogenase